MTTETKTWYRMTCDRCKKVAFEGPLAHNETMDPVLTRDPRRNEDYSFGRASTDDLCNKCLADTLRAWLAQLEEEGRS